MLGFGSQGLVATELKMHRVSQNNFHAKFYWPYGNDNTNHVFCQLLPSLSANFGFLGRRKCIIIHDFKLHSKSFRLQQI